MKLSDRIAAWLLRRNLRGAHRFHGLAGGGRIEIRTKHGVALRIDPEEYVDSFVLRDGYYEEEVLDAVLAGLGPGETFWDVGSFLGLHALTVARLRPDARVLAFEPNPAMAGLIRSAAAANGARLEVLELALDRRSGPARLHLEAGNAGRASLLDWGSGPGGRRIEIAVARGDEIAARAGGTAPNVVKIDVEGSEAGVLEGMASLLPDPRLHTIVIEDSPDESTAVKAIIRSAGFSLSLLQRREATGHNLENFAARRARPPQAPARPGRPIP